MNPRDYDLDELTDVGRESNESSSSRGNGHGPIFGGAFSLGLKGQSPSDQVVESSQFRELFLLQSMAADGSLEKPFLSGVPARYAAELMVFEWLEFLVEKAGFKGAMDVLRYYRSIGWVDEAVEGRLHEYLRGIDEPTETAGDLDRSDHLLSLVYIARIASMATD